MSPSIPLWKQILRQNFTSWEKLALFLELNNEQKELIHKNPKFSLNLPQRLASKIEKGNLEDPILLQFLPTIKEKIETLGFESDPVADQQFRCSEKLLRKYEGRVLLILSGACAMHCRFCFRQNFEYDVDSKSFDNEINYIANDPSINEVILSGGDPLSLNDNSLADLLRRLSNIKHVNRIRFHSRFPIGIPERIDESFLTIFDGIRPKVWFVIHCNHPAELDEEVLSRLQTLQQKGVILLSQSVLLKGVNDNAKTMKLLCEKLVDNGIFPYYLHQLDRVQGTSHFEVEEKKGLQLIEEISCQLSGYAIPKYVREISGQPSKTPIG